MNATIGNDVSANLAATFTADTAAKTGLRHDEIHDAFTVSLRL
jgi:hypothetical protein